MQYNLIMVARPANLRTRRVVVTNKKGTTMITLIGRGEYFIKAEPVVTIDGHQFKQVTRETNFGTFVDYEPVQEVPSGHVGWMYDGARLVDDREYKIRDRAETSEEYAHLSM